MADTFRWVRGEVDLVHQAPASATVIEVGDLIFQHPTLRDPKNAGAMIDQGSLALNQDAFQQFFLGVALGRSRSGDTAKIPIATSGVFRFPCASASFDVGDMVGGCEVAAGTALEDQKVVEVASESLAIGVVTEKATTVTEVEFEIRSTIMRRSLQVQVAGSSSGAV